MQQDQLYELDFNNFIEVNPTPPQHQSSFEESMLLNWNLKDKAKHNVSQDIDPRAAQLYSSPLSSPTNGFPTPISEDLLTNTPENKTLNPLFPLLDISPIEQTFKTVGPLCQLQKADQDKTAIKLEDHETRRWRQTNRNLSSSTTVSQLVASAFATVDFTIRNKELLESQQEQASFGPDPDFKLRKVAHNAIERRYRNNINDRIRDLKNAVPALYMAKVKKDKRSMSNKKGEDIQETSSSEEDSDAKDSEDDSSSHESKKQRSKQNTIGEIIEGVEVARKLNKATILQKATEYIHYLKRTIALAERESQILQHIIAQMPDGSKFLSSFQTQKVEFQQAEQERLMNERKANIEKERQLRERMLRERAAERAALARVLPKRERRPYHRKSKQELEEKRRQEKLLKKKLKSEKQEQVMPHYNE
ncbi:hypothetical protein CU098_009498 [Rhizopus stolonifer]|uniref:BHLH domain-containing protein n=1 Tax=Rhizopus stolonifer TaxID=4846 RepID=A0A367JSH8_RHIST|nr:hypothetical protein CU098_009498 [Rhizopus stolonifer]